MANVISPAALQGVPTPDVVIDPTVFYAATRRMRFQMRSKTAISGLGSTDTVQLKQTGIVSALEVRVSGTITFGGAIAGTVMSYEWPLNLVQAFRLSANGQSQLVNATGLKIRALEFIQNPKLDDSGRSHTFGATAVTSGTLALASDDWGTNGASLLGPGITVPAAVAYTVDLSFIIPVAADPVSLIGSVYAQSAATNLTLDVQWATQAQIVATLGGGATFTSALNWEVLGLVYSIPNVNGKFVVPDLSTFHQVSEFRQGGLTAGTNEIDLPGVGTGRQLLRVMANAYSSAAPVAVNDTNYSLIGWRFGGSDTPEQWQTGTPHRQYVERLTGVDMANAWGLSVVDFASQFALRDVVDEGTTANLRILLSLVAAPTAGYAQILHETLFAAAVGA